MNFHHTGCPKEKKMQSCFFCPQDEWGTYKIEYVCICYGHPWVSGQNTIPTFTNTPHSPMDRGSTGSGLTTAKWGKNQQAGKFPEIILDYFVLPCFYVNSVLNVQYKLEHIKRILQK